MALTQLTKIDGGGISTTSDYRGGVITATKFVGPIEGAVTGTATTATLAVNAQGLTGTPYTTGQSGSGTAVLYFTVPMDAPATLYYQCTIHAAMQGQINIVS